MKFKLPPSPSNMFKGFRLPMRRSFSQEVQDVLPGTILIQLYGDVDTPDGHYLLKEHHPGREYTAEELCLIAARHCHIRPLAFHLFALVTPDHARWFPPNECITCPQTGHLRFLFRMRLKPDLYYLMKCPFTFGHEAFEYIFLQVRDDFVNDVLQGTLSQLARERMLGMGVTDGHRWGKQEGLSMEKVLDIDPVRFLPKSVADNYKNLKRYLLKNGFRNELKKVYSSSEEPVKLKYQYMNGVLLYVPAYAIETFLLKDEELEIVVDPFHKNMPGIYINDHATTEHICAMGDILDMGFLAEESRVQINRCNQPPKIFVFRSSEEGHSFVALVDGYLRLTKDFYFHVCPAVNSPLVQMLRRNRFHGPVYTDWAKIQLADHHKKTPNVNYLVRQQSNSVDNLVLVFIRPTDQQKRVNQLIINHIQPTGYQVAIPNEKIFETVSELLRYYESGENPAIPLITRLGPAMVHGTDDSGLFLCKAPHILEEAEEDLEDELAAQRSHTPQLQQQRSNVRVISGVNIVPGQIGTGQFTDVYKGFWNKDSKNIQAVAVKQIRTGVEKAATYQALMETIHIMSFWSNTTIVTVLDICMRKFQMLEELAELGSLESYLQAPHQTLYIQHLVTAAEQISQALRYLQEECRGVSYQVHGNLRARNVLVFNHTVDNLKVKLADPGMLRLYAAEHIDHNFNLERLPWLAPELYKMVKNTTIYTDRFAFGTTLWELFSLGDRPFLHLAPEVIKFMATTGRHLDCPQKCPMEIYTLMKKCWSVNPPDRLAANEIVRDIRNISLGMDHMPAGNHYSVDNMGDPPKQYELESMQKPGGVDNAVSLSDERLALSAGDAGAAAGKGGSLPDSMDTKAALPMLMSNLAMDDTTLAKSRPLPDQPGIQYILRRELLKVDEQHTLGQGYYGKVHVGQYNQQLVAVKSLHRITQNHTEFENELKMMIKLKKHPNVVAIIGQCPERGSGAPMLLVMEYVENGCLRNYLRSFKDMDPKTLLRFSQEVAEGMLHLSTMKIVHRDLAARNVLVAKDITMKISDFGLSRLIDPKRNYYKCSKNAEMPLKWCAPESLLYQKFSTKSDVWSYGITAWEIFQLGASPSLCEDKHIHTELYRGNRLAKPHKCTHMVYKQLMLRCWEYDMDNRPDFQDLAECPRKLLDQAEFEPQSVDAAQPPGPSTGVAWEAPRGTLGVL